MQIPWGPSRSCHECLKKHVSYALPSALCRCLLLPRSCCTCAPSSHPSALSRQHLLLAIPSMPRLLLLPYCPATPCSIRHPTLAVSGPNARRPSRRYPHLDGHSPARTGGSRVTPRHPTRHRNLSELTSSTHRRTRSHRTACPGSASATAHTDSGRQSANDTESTAVHKRQLTGSVATFVFTTRVEAAG